VGVSRSSASSVSDPKSNLILCAIGFSSPRYHS
jgi:hypothetical protein